MRGMMIDRNDARFREHAQRDRQGRTGRQRTGERDIVDISGRDSGHAQTRSDGGLRQRPGSACGSVWFLRWRRRSRPSLIDGGGRVAAGRRRFRECSFAVPAFFDFRPGIFQRDGAVENGLARAGVRIGAEVAKALELEAVKRGDIARAQVPVYSRSGFPAKSGFRSREYRLGIFGSEQGVVEADFGIDRMVAETQ